MTITVSFATVAHSIAALAVPGVTIKDIDEIPAAGSLLCPIMFPQPSGTISGIQPVFQTVGTGGTAKIDLSYTLHYVFLECEAGSGINELAATAAVIGHLADILEVMLANDAVIGAIDSVPESIDEIGVIEDPTGNQYWGALLSFKILEFVQ
jgi:hypothetical protein